MPGAFFVHLVNLILKFILKNTGSKTMTGSENNKIGKLILPVFNIYYKAIVIKMLMLEKKSTKITGTESRNRRAQIWVTSLPSWISQEVVKVSLQTLHQAVLEYTVSQF